MIPYQATIRQDTPEHGNWIVSGSVDLNWCNNEPIATSGEIDTIEYCGNMLPVDELCDKTYNYNLDQLIEHFNNDDNKQKIIEEYEAEMFEIMWSKAR